MPAPNIISTAGVEDAAVASALEKLQTYLGKVEPYAKYQYLTVTFLGANVDLDILHTLAPRDPEGVDYEVVRVDRAARIYNDMGTSRKPWTPTTIYLRSDAANAVVTLLLSLRPI